MAEGPGRSMWTNRLRRAPGTLRARVAGGVSARVDTAWILTDGSLCVDGWFNDPDGVPGPLEARVVERGATGTWTRLLRKERPDVAAHVLGVDAGRVPFGFVGRVPCPAGVEGQIALDVRAGGRRARVMVPLPRREAVPEEVFAGIAVELAGVTPSDLEPMVAVMRTCLPPPVPEVDIVYRNRTPSAAAMIGIVVPFYREFEYLRNLLRALAGNDDGVDLTVVCDDPSLVADLVAWIRPWNDDVFDVSLQVIAHDRNAGFATACNTGWRASGSSTTVLLNSDVLVADPQGDLLRLAGGLRGGVAAVAPVLTFPDGSLQHAGMELVAAPDFPGFVLPGHPGKHGSIDAVPDEPFTVPMLTGAALCVRRETLAAVGGVPTVFGRGDFEDVLLSLELRRHGQLVVDPAVRWVHVEGASYRRAELGGIAVTLAKSVVMGERTAGRR